MRARSILLATASAVALAVFPAGAASAAQGQFTYQFYDPSSGPQRGNLTDPPSGTCIDLPELQPNPDEVAFRPRNGTSSTATVFLDADCEGPFFSLNPGVSTTDRLELRSVVFS